MSKKSFHISSSGLKNIIFTTRKGELIRELSNKEDREKEYDEDLFRFNFGAKEVEMPLILAEFISPRVSHIHLVDPTINKLNLEPFFHISKDNEYENKINKLIAILKQICVGQCIDIDYELSEELKTFAILNWNDDLFNELTTLFSDDDNSTENQTNQIKKYIGYLFNFNKFKETDIKFIDKFKKSLIEYLSGHFFMIDQKQLFLLNRNDFYLIMMNDNLNIKDYDSLYDIIKEFYNNKESTTNQPDCSESEHEYDEMMRQKMELYESIKLEELSDDRVNELLNDINAEYITQQLWFNIREIIINDQIKSKKSSNASTNRATNNQISEIEYTNKRFEGILYKLGEGNPKSLLDRGIISITASSVVNSDSNYQPKNILDFDNDHNIFHSNSEPNPWLCIDFKERKVNLSHYSLRSHGYGGKGNCHPKSWNIEGSNDLSTWDTLDVRQNDKSLDDKGASNTFEVSNNQNKNCYYRYLRIQQTGVNTKNDNCFIFSCIEFFGKLQNQ